VFTISGFAVHDPGPGVHNHRNTHSGAKLVGFSLWRSAEGEVYVTFPSRAFGAGTERRFFDYLRAVNGSGETVKTVKAWIVDEYTKRGNGAH
jgi:hypothetical protein